MNKNNCNMLVSKFRGTLLGVLTGDCCGIPYEFTKQNLTTLAPIVKRDLDNLESATFEGPIKNYTDDTEMTIVLAQTLINGYSQKKLAENFTNAYHTKGPNRGYGPGVRKIFAKLKEQNCENPTGPSTQVFGGSGSLGNGGAMRISPVALICYNDLEKLPSLVRSVTEVTHTNIIGINGALLQAYAVHLALHLNPSTNQLNTSDFIDTLIKQMQPHENYPVQEYIIKLKIIKEFLRRPHEPSKSEVIRKLGHGVKALKAVPTAIYCFLRSERKEIKQRSQHPFRSTLEYTLSLAGDTDTIGSMACAISGAYYGEDVISKNILNRCEGLGNILQLANELYEAVENEIK